MNNTYRFLRILSGLSKTLNIAKNVIPIYKDTKPVVNNLKSFYKTIKSPTKNANNTINSKTNNNTNNDNTKINIDNNDKKTTTPSDSSKKNINPKFFL